ncbi:MAG: outer membrane beta-barrel protein [Gammaproteobacteria bacterium]|nr:outer membrane beta-barrel protein [Gammaproteobacteria bacterium]
MKLSRPLFVAAGICAAFLMSVANVALAAQPVVSAVPGDANNPTVQHPMIIGRPITLKGAVDAASIGANWSWDPGDGSAAITGVVDATHWAVWAEHTYAGNAGDVFIATLTVDNTVDPVGTATFEMVARADTVPNRSNTAIAEALWYMHRNQQRFLGDATGVQGLAESIIPMGDWIYPSFGGTNGVSAQGATLNAFEANGHRENGDASNPYAETVNRGMKYLFARIEAEAISPQTLNPIDGAAARNDDPDSNGNGLGIRTDSRNLGGVSGNVDQPYQLGMVMDAIVASGTPGALTTTGPTDVIGRSYADIVQDMVDWYAMAQSDNMSHGGWQYSAFNNVSGSQDNSASGWAATGIVAAEDVFGATVPAWLKVRNQNGLEFTDNESDVSDNDGVHGYNSTGPIWGPFGTSGAAMVQMSMNSLLATTSATPDERWVRTENKFRRNFDNLTGTNPLKRYYYGMFNFSKAMRTAKPAPVTIIGTQVGAAEGGVGCGPSVNCAANGPQPLDWYNHPTSGLAQTVISYQATTGASIGRFGTQNAVGESSQAKHVQPWGTQILTRTLAQAGPIAVGSVSPNPGGENFPITLDHSRSFHQDPNRTLVLFEWDIDNDGTFDISSADASPAPALDVPGGYDCGAGGLPCSRILNLRVTDDASPPVTTTDVIILDLTIPPHAPTAVSGGPYMVCAGDMLTVDGSASFDIDQGNSEAGAADTDRITSYEWELDGASPFNYAEANTAVAQITYATAGVRNIGLRVTDNSSVSYPSASLVDLTNTDNTQVIVADCITADLAVSATAGGSDFIVPTEFTVTATISNGGPDDASQVRVVANLSDLFTIVDVTPTQGSCAATGIVLAGQVQYECGIGDLAAGSSIDIAVVVSAADEGSADFEFTVDIDSGPLVALSDPNLANNSIMATAILIDEVIVEIVGKGKGTGSVGLLEILLLVGAVGLVLLLRRRRIPATTTFAAFISIGLLLTATMASNTVEAQEPIKKGFYLGGAIGNAVTDVDATEFSRGLVDAGFNVSDVTLGDDSYGWKIFAGYMFNDYVGVQASMLDLGGLQSQLTASVPPNQIDDLLRVSTNLLPGRGKGFLADIVLQYPISNRFAVYGTLGMFLAEPSTRQTVVAGGTGSASRSEGDDDFSASIGVSYAAGKRATVKLAWERYDIDGLKTDFPMVAVQFVFGDGR